MHVNSRKCTKENEDRMHDDLVHGHCIGMLAIYVERFTVAFANIRGSCRECITWYPWCFEMEPASYGKAKPYTGHLTVMHQLVCLLHAINDYKVSTGAKHSAKPFRCSRVHLYKILYSPKCQGDPHDGK